MLFKTFKSQRSGGELHPTRWGWWVSAAIIQACAIGCGPAEVNPSEPAELGATSQSVIVANGLSLNGLSLNGLNLNGLSLNGLNLDGFSTASFRDWFKADPVLRDHVMKYVVGCAVPSGATREFTDPDTGITYVWEGRLGLATGWSSGSAATETELQVVSACMAAHANKYDIHVTISLVGIDGLGQTIPHTSQELADYNVREACFFGNLFDGSTGTFGANDGLTLNSSQSSPRVCGLPGSVNASQCRPMVYVGKCSDYCVRDQTGTFYTSCTYGGATYRPVTTRMRPQDIYRCGDGVCQATESCGTGTTPDSCALDCGVCM